MANKRFYWIKLKTDFFNQETIDFLMAQKNGCQYIVLYQMLCLMSANNDGKLCKNMGELIVPYDINKIVRDTKYFDFDTVTVALELFKKIKLIYEENDGILKILNIEEMVGSEKANANAQRQKRFRERKKQLALGVTKSNDHNVTKNNEEIEIDIDKDIYINNNKKEKTNNTKRICVKDYDLVINSTIENTAVKECIHEFIKMRKLIKKPLTIKALELLIKRLRDMTDNSEVQLKILNQSIRNSWQDIYPLKEITKNNYKMTNSKNLTDNSNDDELPDWWASL